METRSIFAVLALLASVPVLADAYKWVDEDGITHYSDIPSEGAEVVDLSEYNRKTGAQIYKAPATAPASVSGQQPAAAQPFKYESLSITSPGPEQTLWNIEGVLTVNLALEPGLQQGHQIRVYFDGKAQMEDGTSFQIEEVFRGVHNIQAEVIDGTGKLMIRSQPNRFYVQQNSVITRRP
jgi:Domain of unknown function (DUF4124)